MADRDAGTAEPTPATGDSAVEPEGSGLPRTVLGASDTVHIARDGHAVVTRRPGSEEQDWDRFRRRRRYRNLVLGFAVPILMLVAWQLASDAEWIDERFYSSPLDAWGEAVRLASTGVLVDQILVTLRRLVIGYVGGSLAGIVVGLVLSQFGILRAAFEPLLRSLYVIPKLALLPILLLIFGLTEMPKLFFVGIGVFFIMAFSTLSAAGMIETSYHEVSRSYRLTRSQHFRWVVWPASLPQVVEALRLASGMAVLLVIAVEFVNANDGIGYVTWHAWELFQADRMYAGIVIISILGVLFSAVVSAIGRLFVPWVKR